MDKKEYVTDKAMDAMLQTAASDIEDKAVDILLDGYEGQNHKFSEKHREDMQKLFKKERKFRSARRIRTYSKRAAVIFIAVIAISAITISSVSAWRVRFMNFILERTQYDTNIKFTDGTSKADNYKFGEIKLEYVPEGFKLEKSESQKNHLYFAFRKDDEFFNFRTRDVRSSLSIDTEGANVKELTINGREALYSENDNIRILVWNYDEMAYILTGSISESELVKIAKSVKK
ncbi:MULTISPECIES: DUF4367 domain-containing protein [unclassified Sedimentibacter]|uniref:DUF4367 domain-containing protein n=1 Tax=unclassified Sedimentibacter TaxID=2649220 RepID=UPI0027DF26C5|nr:DUF4367 domain-containing protein [Sedimentibacter sp. MB35-C1]WMJ76527.1 DUF4367 domain-containing protein [Sedimentibacter sp. MB35-C1]